MRTIAIGVVATALIGFGTAAAQQKLTAQAPDLTPVPARILNGVASVRNVGSGPAGPFVLTVQCQKQGGGSCAEAPGMAAYENPAYPKRLVIPVAGLAAGKVFSHTLPFLEGPQMAARQL